MNVRHEHSGKVYDRHSWNQSVLAELRGLGNQAETTARDLREEFGRKAVVSESVAIEGDRLSYRTIAVLCPKMFG